MTFTVPRLGLVVGRGKQLRSPARQTKDSFVALGEGEAVARVLGALLGHRKLGLAMTSRRAGLSPQSTRRALMELQDRGWVTTTLLDSKKRGRRPYGYTLKASRPKMLEHYQRSAGRRMHDLLGHAQPW